MINIDVSNIFKEFSLVYNEEEKIVEIKRLDSSEKGDRIEITKDEVEILLRNFIQKDIKSKVNGIVKSSSGNIVEIEFIEELSSKLTKLIERIKNNNKTIRLLEEFEIYLEEEMSKIEIYLVEIKKNIVEHKMKNIGGIILELSNCINELKFNPSIKINEFLEPLKKTLNSQIEAIVHDLKNFMTVIVGGEQLYSLGSNGLKFIPKGIIGIKNYIKETECILTETNPQEIIKAINKILGDDVNVKLKTDIEKLNINFLFVILYQLSENAKFHGNAKNVEITINQEDEGIKIIVKDDGIGIDLDKVKASDEDKKLLGNKVILKKGISSKEKDGGSGNYFVQNLTEKYHGGEIVDIKTQKKTKDNDGWTEFSLFFPNKGKVDQKS